MSIAMTTAPSTGPLDGKRGYHVPLSAFKEDDGPAVIPFDVDWLRSSRIMVHVRDGYIFGAFDFREWNEAGDPLTTWHAS